MGTKVLTLPYPEDLPEALGKTSEEFEQEMRFLVAARLYELGRISSGRAAELAEMTRVDCLANLSRYRISVFLPCLLRSPRNLGKRLSASSRLPGADSVRCDTHHHKP